MKYLLGIDVGTSATKAVLFDFDGNTIFTASQEYPLYQPKAGWAEQHPQDWWDASLACIAKIVKEKNCAEDIAAVGLTGQMHSLVALDSSNAVIRKAILWCDQRTGEECDQITDIIGKERLIEITANPAITGFTASKILWLKNHEPQNFQKINKILLAKDYIRYKLTGVFATEVSDASGTQLLDVPNRCWSQEVVEKLGFEMSWLPEVFESVVVSGRISKEAASLTGLKEGTPVAGGGGDQAAGAVGNGIVAPGVVSSTIGTSGVVFAHLDKVSIDTQGRVHTFCHAVPGKWHVMGVTQGAGLSLRWYREQFCDSEKEVSRLTGIDSYQIMCLEAEKSPAGSNGVVYLPYMMGERTPHLDPYAKGVFFGISAINEKNDMTRAVLEGVSYSLLDCLNIIRGMGVDITEVRASGGGGKSALWRQIQADMFEANICTVSSDEGPCLGAALIAGVGAGVYPDLATACKQAVKKNTVQQPNSDNYNVYREQYRLYQALYPALKDCFRA